ncbi:MULTISPECIES: DUF2516 family protein [Janibacter]|uniref:Divalent metal cation (Fe/Co/Zn/Cd) transporter n=2 Tax=Janibacter TaxID=53457 RepID=A0A852VP72_9MICO|nr:divalent metal cation (Fe/Co/Zn/Cd) transporter [Janibacter cremeus]
MQIIGQIQAWIILGLGLLALAMEVYALLHAVRQRPDAFTAAGKQSKTFWVVALAIATLLGFAVLGGGLGLLAIIGIVVAGVYLADVRPAIDAVMGRRR